MHQIFIKNILSNFSEREVFCFIDLIETNGLLS
jgi:hypothetical protein